jgi:hypothetical protein
MGSLYRDTVSAKKLFKTNICIALTPGTGGRVMRDVLNIFTKN